MRAIDFYKYGVWDTMSGPIFPAAYYKQGCWCARV